MEAIIRTENKTLFDALLQFLNKLNFTVETKEEKKTAAVGSQVPDSRKQFNALQLKTKGVKFDREKANER